MWKCGNGSIVQDFKQKLIEMIKKSGVNTKIVVGCDSQVLGSKISYVTVVVVLNVGHGGNFIYKKQFYPFKGKFVIMENRLFQQTIKSVCVAKQVDDIVSTYNLHVSEIHSDVNPDKKYKSNRIASACISLIKGSGYQPVIKPDAFAASQTADSLTR